MLLTLPIGERLGQTYWGCISNKLTVFAKIGGELKKKGHIDNVPLLPGKYRI